MAASSAAVRAARSTHPASQILNVERLEFNVLILVVEVSELHLALFKGGIYRRLMIYKM